MESLRAVGYSLPAAVADVVDNSITAGARRIEVEACWAGSASYLSVRDDGCGMDDRSLVDAMRLGSRSPLVPRSADDLGRFGLGLKTASFSQCRRLTVHSRGEGRSAATRRWDLDVVARSDEWRLLRGAAPDTPEGVLQIAGTTGTVVLWEQMDHVVGDAQVSDGRARDRFLLGLAAVERHLGAVFHRFIQPDGRRARVRITFNGHPVKAWDPFRIGHTATQELPAESLRSRSGAELRVRPFILPHASRLSAADYEAAQGEDGWTAQQGFYVYRNDRLLVSGDWLGLGFHKEEHHKLARIAVELPNSMDQDWAIDVKKSRARPPEYLRDALHRVASATRRRSADVYRHRGKVLARTAGTPELAWSRKVSRGKCAYTVNRNHPLVQELLSLPGAGGRAARALLRLLEETVPVHTILVDGAERPNEQRTPFEGAPTADVVAVATAAFDAVRRRGVSPAAALAQVLALEPFNLYPDAVRAALEGGAPGGVRDPADAGY